MTGSAPKLSPPHRTDMCMSAIERKAAYGTINQRWWAARRICNKKGRNTMERPSRDCPSLG